jgi:sulfotransferase
MNSTKIHFISGQTRSGSELLCNILAQNPKFRSTTTSGIMDNIYAVRNQWNTQEENRATPNPEAQLRVMKAMLHAYHEQEDAEVEVVFDKCRGWANYAELADTLIDHDMKILVPVRDVRQVLSSWEKLYRKNATDRRTTTEDVDYFKAQTTQGRAEILMRADQPVGVSHNRIKDALHRGWNKNMFLIDYDDLCSKPEGTMKAVYSFLGEPYYEHQFTDVEQVTQSDDAVFGFKDLHTIRSEVKPQMPDWEDVLGDWALPLKSENFWKNML